MKPSLRPEQFENDFNKRCEMKTELLAVSCQQKSRYFFVPLQFQKLPYLKTVTLTASVLFSLPYLKTASCRHTGTLSFYSVIYKIRVHSILYPQDIHPFNQNRRRTFHTMTSICLFYCIFSIEFKKLNFNSISAGYTSF